MRNFNLSCALIFEFLCLLLVHLHSLSSACKTHQECRMGSECQIKSDTNSSATLKTGFKYILLRNKCSLGICYDGPIGQKDLCQHYVENYAFVESQPLSIVTECLCSLPENQIDTYKEHTPTIDGLTLFNNHRHTVSIRQGKGTIRFGMGPLASHVKSFRIYVGPFTFRVSDEDIDIEEDKDGEFIKRTHKKPLRKLLHFNATESHFWISLHATWEDQLVGQTYFIKVDIIYLPLKVACSKYYYYY